VTTLPADYVERVYAGVLGKIIGVYLGRPVEGWRHEKIIELVGEVTYYVNDRDDVALKNHRLVVPDDDITGTIAFARAMRDYPVTDLDAVDVGNTWLNYIVPDRTVLWWGGRGMSTEHTAYLHLRDGMLPPHTGSAATNGTVVAEQVGAQIFVEGWALANPGDPERAADQAEMAASVSHDREALHAARVIAALVAQAFVEDDVDKLLDTAQSLIPADSLIRRVIDDVRTWHAGERDWRRAFARIDEKYGYHRYPGNCHVVPNHALVIHALLYGAGDFTRGLGILVSCGWDTDSNAGNLGCITGVRDGLAGIDAGPDWRGPVADRLYLPTADSGGAITDAAREALTIVGYGRALRGEPDEAPKSGARFHFTLPGSVQGFRAEPTGSTRIENVVIAGHRMLAVHYPAGAEAGATTPTFLTPETLDIPPYGMAGSPTLYPGQQVRARVLAGADPVRARLVVRAYDGRDERREIAGPEVRLNAGEAADLQWQVPDTGGHPVAEVGLAVAGENERPGVAYLDHLTWDGEPDVELTRPDDGGTMWRHAWVNAVDRFDARWPEPYRLIHDRGIGMLIQGTREWQNYEVAADITPRLAASAGLAARVQGLRRYYLLRLIDRSRIELVRVLDEETVLAQAPFEWDFYRTYRLSLTVVNNAVFGTVDDVQLEAVDPDSPLAGGGVALVIDEGHMVTQSVRVRPLPGARPTNPTPYRDEG
jgi:ADP-ribosylglycohydrolase